MTMPNWLLQLLSLDATGEPAGWALHWQGVSPVVVLLLAAAAVVGVVWLYRRTPDPLPRGRRWVLTGLRLAFLGLLLGLLVQPTLSVSFAQSQRRRLVILVDRSQSISRIADRRADPDDLKRLGLARGLLDPARGLEQPAPRLEGPEASSSRLSIIQSALTNRRLDLLGRLARDFDVEVYGFDRAAEPLAAPDLTPGSGGDSRWVEGLAAEGAWSALGDALRTVLARQRGQSLAGVLVITDGVSNIGVQPASAAAEAARDGVRLYAWGVGITQPRDIIVAPELIAPDVAFVRDQLAVAVRVRGMGLAGESARLVVRLGAERQERQVAFTGDGEQIVTVTFTPPTPGEFTLSAEVEPRDDEVVRTNNSATHALRIIDGKIKVLYVEQYPRWEYRYLQAILERDRRLEARFVLVEADRSVSAAAGSPFLPVFPALKEDLFKYDLVILGDVDSRYFSAAQLDNLGQYVSRMGGSLVVLAGRRFAPGAYRGTVIEKLLPVELELDSAAEPGIRPIQLELTPAGKASPLLRLADGERDSIAVWAQLPPVFWTSRVARPKPAAEVLLVDPTPAYASRYGKMPVLAQGPYGLGQVMFIGTDNFWRWRKNTGDTLHARLWGQIIQRLALPHLLGTSRRTQLATDARRYHTGQTVSVYGRLYTETFDPLTQPVVTGRLTSGAAGPRSFQLAALADQPGIYRGTFNAPPPGRYTLNVESDPTATIEIEVVEPDRELVEPAMNESVLRQLAQATGGAFLREEDLYDLPNRITAGLDTRLTTRRVALPYTWPYLALLLATVTAEWALRKFSHLK